MGGLTGIWENEAAAASVRRLHWEHSRHTPNQAAMQHYSNFAAVSSTLAGLGT